MMIQKSEEMGLFTFYYHQSHNQTPRPTDILKKEHRKNSKDSQKLFARKTINPSTDVSIPVPSRNKLNKIHSVFKQSSLQPQLSNSAQLKAQLRQLTTQKQILAPVHLSKISSKLKKEEPLKKKKEMKKYEKKPVLKGIDLNQNMVPLVAHQSYEKPRLKTGLKVRKFLRKSLTIKEIIKSSQPLLLKLNKDMSGGAIKMGQKMEPIESKHKKAQSHNWKNPVKETNEPSLIPVNSERRLLNLTFSMQLQNNPQQFRFTQLNHHSGQHKYKGVPYFQLQRISMLCHH